MIDSLFLSLALMLTPCNEIAYQVKVPVRDQFGEWRELDFKFASYIGLHRHGGDDNLWIQRTWEGLPDDWWITVGGSSTNCDGSSGFCGKYKDYVLVCQTVKLYRTREEYEANDPVLWFNVWEWGRLQEREES